MGDHRHHKSLPRAFQAFSYAKHVIVDWSFYLERDRSIS